LATKNSLELTITKRRRVRQ